MTHAANPMAEGQTPKPPRQARKKRDITDIIIEADDWWMQLKRALAGYNSLTKALQTFQGETPDDERAKGLPVFEFAGNVDGRNAIKVCADLKKIDPQYVPHVLVPIINSFGGEMIESLEELEIRVAELKKLLSPQQGQAPAA